MNKLENEYKQLMQSETPDLWSRIEAGVDERLATSEDVETYKSDRNNVINWRKYSLPLVACIAAIMCVPLLLTGFFRMAGGTKGAVETADCAMVETTTATMDCVAEESIEESAAQYATETCMDTADIEEAFVEEEAAEEEMAETEVYAIQSTEDSADGNTTENIIEEYDNAKSADTDNADTGGTGADKQAKGETLRVTHTLTVTEIAVLDEKSAGSHEGGTVYHMVTEEKGECTLFVPDDLDYQIDMNRQFTIKAETTDAWYDYVLLEIW